MEKRFWIPGIITVFLIIFISFVLVVHKEVIDINQNYIVGAHRGNSVDFVENTIEAFESAVQDEKYKFIEVDFQYTLDKKIIAFHDSSLRRLQGDNTEVSKVTYEKLLEISEYHIPTYEEFMDLVDGKKPINIEIKSQGNENDDKMLADFIIDDLDGRSLLNSTLISSISKEVVKYINDNYNDLNAEDNNHSEIVGRIVSPRKVDTGIIFYVSKTSFTYRLKNVADVFTFGNSEWLLSDGLIEDLRYSDANYLMIYGANVRRYDHIVRYLPPGGKIVFWDFGDRMYLVKPPRENWYWIKEDFKVTFFWED